MQQWPTHSKPDLLHLQKITMPEKVLPVLRARGQMKLTMHLHLMPEPRMPRIWARPSLRAKEMVALRYLLKVRIECGWNRAGYWAIHAWVVTGRIIDKLNNGILACQFWPAALKFHPVITPLLIYRLFSINSQRSTLFYSDLMRFLNLSSSKSE